MGPEASALPFPYGEGIRAEGRGGALLGKAGEAAQRLPVGDVPLLMSLPGFLFFGFLLQDPARLIERLHSRSIDEREQAERALVECGEKALPHLDRAARSEDSEVSRRAERVIRVVLIRRLMGNTLLKGSPGVDRRLAEGKAGDWTAFFLEAIEERGIDPQGLEFIALMALLGASSEESPKVLEKAARMNLLAAEIEVSRLLRSEDLSEKALLSLARLSGHDPPPAFAPLLRSPLAEVRFPAARILETLGGAGASEYALDLAKDSDARTRQVSSRLLGAGPAPVAIPVLRKLLRDPTVFVRAEAIRSLGRLDAREAVADLGPSLRDPSGGVRAAAASALGRLGARELIPELVGLLSDESASVRSASVEALGELGARGAIPEISRLKDDPNEGVRLRVAKALSKLSGQ